MSSVYGSLIAGIEATLLPTPPDEQDPSPFKNALAGLDAMGDEDLAAAINAAATGDISPAFGVLLPRGEADGGKAGALDETLEVWVIVVVAARTTRAAVLGDKQTVGMWELVEAVRDRLHNVSNINGIVNPLQYLGHERLRIGHFSLTVGARIVRFLAPLQFPDRPASEEQE